MSDAVDMVAIGAHPDDVELFCGGIVALSARQGHRVVIVDLTRGELASRGTPETRAAEAATAARALGVEREQLGLRDGGIRDDDASTTALAALLRRLRPRVVLAPWSRARHPDHAAASHLVDRAVFFAHLAKAPVDGVPHRVSRVLYYLQRVGPTPDVLVDVTPFNYATRGALAGTPRPAAPRRDGPQTLVGSPDAVAAIEARDRAWGTHLGVGYAEGLCSTHAIPVDDVVAHFGDRAEPHFSTKRR